MQVAAGIVLIQNTAVEETFLFHVLLIQLAANEHQFGLLIIGSRLVEYRRQAGFLVFVAVPSRNFSADGEGVPVFFVKKAHRIKILFFHKFQRIPLWADMNR